MAGEHPSGTAEPGRGGSGALVGAVGEDRVATVEVFPFRDVEEPKAAVGILAGIDTQPQAVEVGGPLPIRESEKAHRAGVQQRH